MFNHFKKSSLMRYKDKAKAREKYVQNRQNLIAQSKLARMLMEMGQAESVNDGLLTLYDNEQGQTCDYNTFHQWKEKGFTILKGARAFCVWGQPRNASQTPEGSEEPEEYKYWPICYLFSELQVIKPEQPEPRPEPEEKPESVAVLEMDSILN